MPAELEADLRTERCEEGQVAQILHLGPYAHERPTIERLHSAIAAAGLRPRGRHHELYLGDASPARSFPAERRVATCGVAGRAAAQARRDSTPPVRQDFTMTKVKKCVSS